MSKGRTWRRRAKIQKLKSSFKSNPEAEQINYNFNQWIKSKFNYKADGLKIKYCGEGAGNGVYAGKTFPSGSSLITIPRKMMIGVHLAYKNSSLIRSILKFKAERNQTESYLCSMQILMLFLIEQYRNTSSFKMYISVLPTSFTHFLYWSEEEICCMPDQKLYAAKQLRSKLELQMNELNKLIDVVGMFDPISWQEYKWAWCCVNTRCVYSDHNKNVPLPSPSIKSSSSDFFYLIPFLDMLNHHPNACVEASFNHKIDSFQIITLKKCAKYSELFIKYGEHDSLDLLYEYGFVAHPKNCPNINDNISFTLKQVCTAFQLDLSEEIQHICVTLKDLSCVINTGPTWQLVTCCVLLSIITSQSGLDAKKVFTNLLAGRKVSYVDMKLVKEKIRKCFGELLKNKETEYKEKLETIHGCSFSVHIMFLERYYEIVLSIVEQCSHNLKNDDNWPMNVL